MHLPPLKAHFYENFEHTGKIGAHKVIDDMIFKGMCFRYNVWSSGNASRQRKIDKFLSLFVFVYYIKMKTIHEWTIQIKIDHCRHRCKQLMVLS